MGEQLELPSWAPGFKETASFHEDLRKSARLRKMINRQKRFEQALAKPIKRLLLKFGLVKYTGRIKKWRTFVHQLEEKAVQKAYRLRSEKRIAYNAFANKFYFGESSDTNNKFLDACNAFNNFCLGIALVDPELASEIESEDILMSMWESTPVHYPR
ncbi:hypothetical protein K8Q96_00630 [Candidatus Nomurabacteria bacterium]|nr:hypothetical protein [Candidatus Nomurabacteria bacterium]